MRLKLWMAMLGILLMSSTGWALDPMAPRSERGSGRVTVKTPQPDNKITVTSLRGGGSHNLQDGQTISVPVGPYMVEVQMQNYTYKQSIHVDSTETEFIVVPGYGNLKVNSINPNDNVTVTKHKGGAVVATFPASETITLPRGHYDVKVQIPGHFPAVKENVWVVTNTTRVLDVHPDGTRR